ncbi:MAG: polyphosphate polymerase domain-containing protein [Candidatus Bathyarchaeia archaeon]|jgi:hypothetical protein
MSVKRRELKYSINPLEYQVLKSKVAYVLKPDPHMVTGASYQIRNVYFDDYKDTAYWEKEAGTYQRKKYRIRIYNNDDAVIKFERKSKIGGYVFKKTTLITRQQAEQLINGNFDFIADSDNKLLKEFYFESRRVLMKPIVIVEYNREAYVQPIGNVRVTFDSNLRTGPSVTEFFNKNASVTSTLAQQEMVLEVKYTDFLPVYVKGLFPNTIKLPEAIGKFSICRSQQMLQTGAQ